MRRWRQFLLESLAAIFAAGLLLAAALPLLSLTIGPVPPMTTRLLALAIVIGCVLLATLREGGSLRG